MVHIDLVCIISFVHIYILSYLDNGLIILFFIIPFYAKCKGFKLSSEWGGGGGGEKKGKKIFPKLKKIILFCTPGWKT